MAYASSCKKAYGSESRQYWPEKDHIYDISV